MKLIKALQLNESPRLNGKSQFNLLFREKVRIER
jgi:hypothetical protein